MVASSTSKAAAFILLTLALRCLYLLTLDSIQLELVMPFKKEKNNIEYYDMEQGLIVGQTDIKELKTLIFLEPKEPKRRFCLITMR